MTKDEALKLALEALEETTALCINYESVEEKDGYQFTEAPAVIEQGKAAITAIKEALAQPEQEFVAYIDMSEWPPVRFKEGTLRCDIAHLDGQKLYTTPPQRKPLTDEQIAELCHSLPATQYTTAFARAIEAAHGIKE